MAGLLQDNIDFLDATLDKFMSREGKGMKMANLLLNNTYEFSEIIKANKIELDGGSRIKFDLLIRAGGQPGFVAPWAVREVRQKQHNVRGVVDWSNYETDWSIEETEEALNQNAGSSQVFSLMEQREEAMHTESHNDLEDIYFHEVGNMDDQGGNKSPFIGQKGWVTRDGLNVDGSSTVAGVNCATDPRYLSRYCGPFGSNFNTALTHDTADSITNANQLLRKMNRAWRYIRYTSPNDVRLKMAQDDKKLKRVAAQRIQADEIAFDALEVLLSATGHGQDDMAKAELQRPDPVWRGIPITFVDQLGLASAGVPAFAAHDQGRGNIVAGAHANTGELFMMNYTNLKVFCQKGFAPLRAKLEFLPTQRVAWQLYRWILGTICNDRARQCKIWGFSPLTAN